MEEKKSPGAFEALEEKVLEYLNSLEPKERLESIDDLIHCLQFERRLMLLTPEELEHMDRALSPAARRRLDESKTEKEREELIEMYSRAKYIRDCAWMDYLNGVTDVKPFDSKKMKKAA